jgi:hypothetical protein
MMISGAAKDSEPHRVVRCGVEGEMKRESPKSVSLIRGREAGGSIASISVAEEDGASLSRGLTVRRISVAQPGLGRG